jgi:hypothetical protein
MIAPPNQRCQPTPEERFVCGRTPLVRRGCANRWAMRCVIYTALSLAAVCSFTGCKITRAGDDALYGTFQAQDKFYFSQLAHYCDSLLSRHPPGSDDLRPHQRAPDFFELSKAESLPPGIKTLSPDYILVSTNRIWVNCGGGRRMDWGFMWGQCSAPNTNTWALRSCLPYSFERTLYVESR